MSAVMVGVLVGIGWAAAAGQVESPAPELRFWLESSRQLCTEGTLTEIRWRGGGGGGNLWPHVNGRMIGENTYRVKVNCGMIPRTEDGELDETQLDAVITGFLRDGRGTIKSASIRIPRAPALPAPIAVYSSGSSNTISVLWRNSASNRSVARMLAIQRFMLPGDTEWTYTATRLGRPGRDVYIDTTRPAPAGSVVKIQGAQIRHQIEAETPDALSWTETINYQTAGPPTSFTASATHDAVTISWVPVPPSEVVRSGACQETAVVRGDNGENFAQARAVPGERSQVAIRGLEPDTKYTIVINPCTLHAGYFENRTIRTASAPSGWSPLPRGPQNVRVTATQRTITVRWDDPFTGAAPVYQILLSDGHSDGGLAIDSLSERPPGGWLYIFRDLTPGTLYRVRVGHHGLVYGYQDLIVTTAASPDSGATGRQTPGSTGIPEPGEVMVGSIFTWPADIHNHPRPNPPL